MFIDMLEHVFHKLVNRTDVLPDYTLKLIPKDTEVFINLLRHFSFQTDIYYSDIKMLLALYSSHEICLNVYLNLPVGLIFKVVNITGVIIPVATYTDATMIKM